MTSQGACSIRGCGQPHVARGWCRSHYGRWARWGDPLGGTYPKTAAQRFWSHVDKGSPTDCWLWMASRLPDGYGNFSVAHRPVRAHRWSYQEAFGEIPDRLHVLHHCDNPPCVNPGHLFLGTHADNMRDSARKGRQGHPGSRNGRAKLTVAQVRDIRQSFTGHHGEKSALARKYGVSCNQICLILSNRSWTNAN